ncbi:MAG TPA: AMP-binding protein [Acidimicrobiales bacterium]|nr:AMP-binding protein [Acidimicrobiales bacterium]
MTAIDAGGSAGTFWALVEAAAVDRPDSVILSDDHGRSLTTAGYRDAAMRAAAGLAGHGVGPGTVVSWQLPTTLEAAVLMAALAGLGAVQNPIIPVFREREIAFIVEQVDTALLVVPETWRGFDHGAMARATGRRVLALDLDGEPGSELRLPEGDPAHLTDPPQSATERRWVYYSSGTTADPKGVCHHDAGLIASSNGMVDGLELAEGDVYPIAWPFAHIGGIAMLSAVLRAGGTLVLFDVFDPATVGERMAAHQPTILGSATPFFNAYLAAQRRHGAEPLFPRLRACVAGGAPTPAAVNREVAEVLGVDGVLDAWGLTEFPVATSESPRDPNPGTTVGRPVTGVDARVVDGELRLKGPQCFVGYVDASLDAAAFDGEGWFRTGDLGSVTAEGRVRVEGRLKDIIIRNAENISALEVEEALLLHESVADVAVLGVPDERTGERVCAVVVPAPDAEPSLDGLVAHCLDHGLARFKCPEQLEVVEELPRSPMGKVQKRAIRIGSR